MLHQWFPALKIYFLIFFGENALIPRSIATMARAYQPLWQDPMNPDSMNILPVYPPRGHLNVISPFSGGTTFKTAVLGVENKKKVCRTHLNTLASFNSPDIAAAREKHNLKAMKFPIARRRHDTLRMHLILLVVSKIPSRPSWNCHQWLNRHLGPKFYPRVFSHQSVHFI